MPRKINSLFRMPAEWEKQQSTLIGWPYNKNDWPGMFKNIPNVFAKIISKISETQKVNLLIKNSSSKNTIKKLLKKNNAKIHNIKFIICKTDRVWMRDIGPIFIKDKKNKNILLNWKFNGWAKYKNYKDDNKVILRIKNYYKGDVISPKFNKKLIANNEETNVVARPTIRGKKLNENISLKEEINSTNAAREMAGMPKRKENFAASRLSHPVTSAVEIVIPDLETPGKMAKA